MDITYTNHKGSAFLMGPDSAYHYGKHTLHDVELSYEIDNGRADALRREPREHELPIMIDTENGADGLKERECLRAVLSVDIQANTAGTIEINGWRMQAKPVRVTYNQWWLDDRYIEAALTLLAEDPAWRRDQSWSFAPDRSPAVVGTQLDFPIGFPYDFTPNPPVRRVEVEAEGPCAWRLIVYGPATDPYVIIGGNRYQVTANVPAGGILVADSRDWSIIVRDADGNEQDAFAGRIRGKEGSGEYMWAPILPGVQAVSWSNAFGWDITVYEERDSAPCS